MAAALQRARPSRAVRRASYGAVEEVDASAANRHLRSYEGTVPMSPILTVVAQDSHLTS